MNSRTANNSSRGKIFVLSGPSGSGKTTLHEAITRDKALKTLVVKTISATTRKRRPGEKSGVHYLFLREKDFLRKARAGYFLEWQKVFDAYYGTPKKTVEKLLKKGQNVLLCIDVKGAKVVFRQFRDAVGIFVKTPSLGILRARLHRRASENRASFVRRMTVARRELTEEKRYRYTVVNGALSKAIRQLKGILIRETRDP